MRVWLSGGGGFTGRALHAVLEGRGHQVWASQIDLRDSDRIHREMSAYDPEAIVHLAAISQPTHQPAIDFYAVNALGTEAVLSAASSLNQLKRIVLASSATVYGDTAKSYNTLSEDLPPQPVGHYAISKLAMERVASRFKNLPLLVVRPFNYTGPGQSDAFLLGKVAALLRQGADSIALGNLELARDFTSLDEVVRVYVACLERCSVHHGVMNICSGHAQSLRGLVDALIEASGRPVEIQISDKFKRGSEVESLCGDVSRMQQWIGFVPKPLGRDDLRRMLFNDEQDL